MSEYKMDVGSPANWRFGTSCDEMDYCVHPVNCLYLGRDDSL